MAPASQFQRCRPPMLTSQIGPTPCGARRSSKWESLQRSGKRDSHLSSLFDALLAQASVPNRRLAPPWISRFSPYGVRDFNLSSPPLKRLWKRAECLRPNAISTVYFGQNGSNPRSMPDNRPKTHTVRSAPISVTSQGSIPVGPASSAPVPPVQDQVSGHIRRSELKHLSQREREGPTAQAVGG